MVADGENFTVTVGAGARRSPSPHSKRKVTTSHRDRGGDRADRGDRGERSDRRSRSRSKSPAISTKKKSIKDRLGPVSDTEKPTFKSEHWNANGKSKLGKNERNGGARNQRASSKDRKRDRDRDS